MEDPKTGGGLNEAAAAGVDEEALGGTGGSSGGGTIAGSGDPSGGTPGGPAGAAALARFDPSGVAGDAAALGPADGSLADAASGADPGAERLSAGPTGAEAIGAGATRGEAGSGTPPDRGELGGGGSDARLGGTARPGGDSRA